MTSLRILAALGLCAALSACATPRAKVPDQIADPRTPTEQFEAKVSSRPEEIRLAIHAQGVSSTQAAALAAFAGTWRDDEGGAIRIQSPTGTGATGAAAYRTAEGARAVLVDNGVPDRLIELAPYDPAGAADAPVVVGYLIHQVTLPRCGDAWTNLASSRANRVQPNFGCSVTANMAAQIANPADLAAPRGMDPADAQRRATVLEKYRAGEVTSAAVDEKADGAVSQAVK